MGKNKISTVGVYSVRIFRLNMVCYKLFCYQMLEICNIMALERNK